MHEPTIRKLYGLLTEKFREEQIKKKPRKERENLSRDILVCFYAKWSPCVVWFARSKEEKGERVVSLR